MLLALNVPGAAGARRAALLKYKRFDDAELEIVGANSARGTNAGCVVWHCATETCRTFEVVPACPNHECRFLHRVHAHGPHLRAHGDRCAAMRQRDRRTHRGGHRIDSRETQKCLISPASSALGE
jgi:hypothetical protein